MKTSPAETGLTAFLLARVAEDRAAASTADPGLRARAVAECESKRILVELHADGGPSQGHEDEDGPYTRLDHACETCGKIGEYGVPWPCESIKAVATVYSGHPEYRPEWRIA